MRKHSETREFACWFCSYKAKTNHALSYHEETHLDRDYRDSFPCTLCDRTYLQKRSLKDHMDDEHASTKLSFHCDKCDKVLVGKVSIKQHRYRCSAKRKFACTECEATFMTRDHLGRHMNTHSDARPFLCHTCSKAFKSKYALFRHSITKHGSSAECLGR